MRFIFAHITFGSRINKFNFIVLEFDQIRLINPSFVRKLRVMLAYSLQGPNIKLKAIEVNDAKDTLQTFLWLCLSIIAINSNI